MIKKVLIGILIGFVLLILLAGTYVFSLKVDRPNENIEVLSLLHKEEFRNSVPEAVEWVESAYDDFLIPSLSVAVGIDHSFNTYVKDYASEKAGYTIKQLLTHQAGIRHYKGFSEMFNTKEYVSTKEAASIVENDDLLFTPGAGFNYSTDGYTLISLAMESASNASFEEIMINEVFLPIGMSSTYFDKISSAEEIGASTPYMLAGDYLFVAPRVNVSNKYAGGGFLSTPSDMVKFGNALLGNSFLNPESRQILWRPIPLNNGDMNPQNYALGFRIGKDDFGNFVHHGGTSVGGYSFFIVYPEIAVVVAFATNTTPRGFDRLKAAQNLVSIFTEKI